jgi:dihydroorotate dehydrogenase electron transfer subunit
MFHKICPITKVCNIGENIYTLSFISPEIAGTTQPGQFVNVRINNSYSPLLRRPFSVYFIEGDEIKILFNNIGRGTKILSEKKDSDKIDVIGPLGKPFTIDSDCSYAFLVGGGMGVASLPLLTKSLAARGILIETFVGARTSKQLITENLINVHIATDDGSKGFHGTVVDLLQVHLSQNHKIGSTIYACGPMPMLKKVSELAEEFEIPCEVSIETMMACGIGICQGCVVERMNSENKYSLVCKDGPVFNSKTIRI